MCECGCGMQEWREAFRIKGTRTVVAYQIFPGCKDCDYGPAVAISFFDSPKNEFLEGVKIETVQPNEYGSGRDEDREPKWRAGGFGFGILDVEDLVAAARKIEEQAPVVGYESVAEWLEEYGSDLLSDAVWRWQERDQKRHAAAKGKP